MPWAAIAGSQGLLSSTMPEGGSRWAPWNQTCSGDPGPAAAPNAVDFLDFLFLPYPADAAGHAHVARHASWSVMRFCERHRLFPETPGEGPGHLLH